MPDRDVADLTDEQLLVVMAPRRWEKRLEEACISGPVAAVLFVVAAAIVGVACAWMYDPSGMPVIAIIASIGLALFAWIFLGVIAVILLFGAINSVAGHRARHARRELDRRYGGAWPAHYLSEARAAVARQDGSEWLAVFTGDIQPHGGDVLLRLRIATARAGPSTVEVRGKRDAHLRFENPQPDLPEIRPAMFELDDAESAEALELLRAQRPGDVTFHSTVIDGFPYDLVVACRDLDQPSTLSCNLVGLPRDADGHPAVRLARWMLTFRDRVPSSCVIVGSCDWNTGTIRIGAI